MYGKIYCIVLNWNGKHFLENCLSSVFASDYKNLKVIVVDNASTDGSQEFVSKRFKKAFLIRNKSNLGWTGGNNVGIKRALKEGASAIFILNNDTIIDKKCITNLSSELFKKNNTGIVGPKIYLTSNKLKKTKTISFAGGRFTRNRYFGIHIGNNTKDIGQFSKVKSSEYITGAAIMIKREVFEKVGLFDFRYFIYYEEADFCMRSRKLGFKILFIPTALIYHVFSGTVEINSPFQKYYTTRNHYLFVEKNAPFEVKVREILRTPKTIAEFLLNFSKEKYSLFGVMDYFLRRFGKRRYWI